MLISNLLLSLLAILIKNANGENTGSMGYGASASNTKRVTAVFDTCYKIVPPEIQATAVGNPRYRDLFRVDVRTKHIWGFVADVVRTDKTAGWGQKDSVMSWTLLFGNLTDYVGSTCVNNSVCANQEGGQTCTCLSGFAGPNCTNIDDCLTVALPCLNNGTCLDEINGYSCHCLPGFNGSDCSTDIDECQLLSCQNNGTCYNQVGTYICSCVLGFTGQNCETDIDECLPTPCDNNATCTDLINGYQCICRTGYEGTNCSTDIDECFSQPCKNNATCNDEIDDYSCTCKAGFTGENCATDINECESRPCQNGGNCTDLTNSYQCTCRLGYSGQNCSIDTDECETNPCENEALCEDSVNNYTCTCRPGYKGRNCSEDINECVSSPCKNNGICIDLINDYRCNCPPEFSGTDCQTLPLACSQKTCHSAARCVLSNGNYSCVCNQNYEGDGLLCKPFCTEEKVWVEDLKKYLTFPKTSVDYTASSIELCPTGRPLASRDCVCTSSEMFAAFGDVYTPSCNITTADIVNKINERMSGRDVSSSLASLKLSLADGRNAVETESAERIVSGLERISTIIKRNRSQLSTNAMFDTMVATESLATKLFSDNLNHKSIDSPYQPTLKQRLYGVLQNMSLRVRLEQNRTSESLSTANMTLQIVQPSKSDEYTEVAFSPFYPNKSNVVKPPVKVIIPDSVINDASKKLDDDVYVAFMYFNNDDLFSSTKQAEFVVSVTIRNYHPSTTDNYFRLVYNSETSKQGSSKVDDESLMDLVTRTQCSVWDTHHLRWVPNGCQLVENTFPPECKCYKLANFAMLIDTKILPSAFAIGVTTYVGIIASSVCLVVTAAIYFTLSELRSRQPTTFLLHICFCLFMVNITFITGASQVHHMIPCYITTALLHYFLLATWTWMTANAYNMYNALVRVIGTSDTLPRFSAIVGYIAPLVVVSVNGGVAVFYKDLKDYRPDDILFESAYKARHMCWLRLYSLYYGFLLPVGILAFVNLCLFVIVLFKITCRRNIIKSSSNRRTTKDNFMIAIAMIFMMGLNWIFGFLMLVAENVTYQLVMAWLFTIFNSTQGVSIFFLNCVRQPSVRQLWCKLGPRKQVKPSSNITAITRP